MEKDIVKDLLDMANSHANEEAELLNAAASEIYLLRDERDDAKKENELWEKRWRLQGETLSQIGKENYDCAAILLSRAEAAEADNARLLQSALASQRDADKLMEKLHTVGREIERMAADIAYLADRASAAGRFGGRTPRDYGTSSNAIVAYAYGGAVPSACYMPCDKSDLAACELAVARMPEHRKTPEVLAALERAKKAVRC